MTNINDFFSYYKKLAMTPKTSLEEQAKYWQLLNKELNDWKCAVKLKNTKLKVHIVRVRHPKLFRDIQTLHQANKEIDELIRSSL